MEKIRSLFSFNKLKTKILFSFSIVMILIVFLSGFTIYSMNTLNKDLESVLDQEMEILITSEKLVINLLDRTRLIQGNFLFNDIEYKRSYDASVEDNDTLINRATEIVESSDYLTSLDKLSEWDDIADDTFSTYYSGNIPEARTILNERLESFGTELINEFQLHADNAEERIAVLSDEIQQNTSTMMMIAVLFSVIVIILGVTVALITARKITRPIETLMKRMKSIASGHLNNTPLTINTDDEIGQLVSASNEMNKNMREIMLKITDVTDTLATHSDELTKSTNEVRQGSEQITTTMEELASGSETQANQASALSSIMSNF